MKVIGVDTETTGLEQAKGHRIIEIAIVEAVIDASGMTITDRYVQRINPLRAIDPGAEAVHKIRIQDLIGMPEWKDVAPTIANRLKNADLVVAHNMDFDGPFIAAELLRVGIMPPNVEAFCTMASGRWATPLGKLPKLSELCWSLGIEYEKEKAHAAEYDVEVTLACLLAGVQRGLYTLPERKVAA